MSKKIEAVYENGVFKPLEVVEIREHEKVAIKVVSHDEWQKRFDSIIKKIHKKTAQYSHKKTAQYSSEEIEGDIAQAVKEARKEKYGR
jgi:predicted DNA-binding antitoxin AbrB/MazE fold protein